MNKEFTLVDYIPVFLKVLDKLEHRLDPAWLPEGFANLGSNVERLSMEDCHQFFENCFAATRDHRIAFEYGKALKYDVHGFFGYALKSAKNLEEIIELDKQFIATRLSNVDLALERFESHFACNILFKVPKKFIPAYMETLLSIVQYQFLPLTHQSFESEPSPSPKQSPRRSKISGAITIHLSYPRPAHFHLYEEYLDFDCQFDCSVNSISAPIEYLQVANRYYDPSLKMLAVNELKKIESNKKESKAGGEEDTVLIKIRNILADNLEYPPSAEQCADQLFMSSRTLKRKLAIFQTNYTEVLHELRCNEAMNLLDKTPLSVENIALRVGYAHASSFINAFKKRVGKTPAAYRKQGI